MLSCCFYRTTCCKPLVGFDQISIFMFIFLIFQHEYSKARQYSHSPIRKVLIGASVYSLGPRQYNLTVLMDVSCGVYSLLSSLQTVVWTLSRANGGSLMTSCFVGTGTVGVRAANTAIGS